MSEQETSLDRGAGRPTAGEESDPAAAATPAAGSAVAKGPKQKPGEHGGPPGPEPTRYGDWEIGGRCSDF